MGFLDELDKFANHVSKALAIMSKTDELIDECKPGEEQDESDETDESDEEQEESEEKNG